MAPQRQKTTSPHPASTPRGTANRLQALPAELRNNIYEYVAFNERKTIHLRNGHVLQASPLSKTCKQIRQEYRNIYIQAVLVHGTAVVIHVPDFQATPRDLRPCRETLINEFTNSTGLALSPTDIAVLSSHRQYVNIGSTLELWQTTIVIDLTNNFYKHLKNMDFINMNKPPYHCNWKVEVDPKTFDFEHCWQLFEKVTDAYSGPELAVKAMLRKYGWMKSTAQKRKRELVTKAKGGKRHQMSLRGK